MDTSIITSVILGVFGLGITAYYSSHTKKIADEKMLKQLFTEFNERYSELNDYLKEIEDNCPTLEKLKVHKNNVILKQKIIDYFSLCAEEFYWYYHKKRIDEIIWRSWKCGMNYWFQNVPAIKDLWDIEVESNGKDSYYITTEIEFFQE